MSNVLIGLLSFPVILLLIFLRVPIGLAMLGVGIFGSWLLTGTFNPVMAQFKSLTYSTFASYSLSVVPLFILMGQFATLSGMSAALFNAAASWLGHRKGGVAMAAVGASAGFGAICGSSLATAATMGHVALPELKKYGYSGALSTGAVAAGGTLGILIPPSVILVIFAVLTEQNIAKLFMAAFVPGILAAIGYLIVVAIYVRVSPESAGIRARVPYGERFRELATIWPVVAIFVLVIGGIYTGIFTPTEAAAVGAAGTGLVALVSRSLSRKGLKEAILGTASSTAMIFLIVLGAASLNGFLALSQLPQFAAGWVTEQGFNPWIVMAIVLLLYLVLGCVMDSLSMILLTVPIIFPMMSALDFGLTPDEFAIWFGILVLIVVEVGLITPPVGMNLFIINSMAKGTRLSETFRGALPFVASDIIRTIILVAFPPITLGLVWLLY
ncbi:TRAP transporter large permease [Pelagibacterium halotolerans]|uniref:TRAP transporter large permease protein n=1 Tax=Pelagibacterium halotolerans (strain DSM 22347 / JCM 15775 / CGMCC 1.7692 / B2) TaxID=1082931 RepID=G4R7V8_PELHB|nr:TRAP transporter large permease [Pelagibacterium halotolerans]AEQ50253.1 TRAP dicarboxylate transporter, DctM subunit, unknown substrate 3 [Pelagibacterium halotolerans B2]QJR19753.1 TRAP transporter large permease [Pelagibacterium halotolerans]SEA51962.1 TRAP transporter, DctM subunit [Pelagibacterium halotolerans]